MKGAFGSLNVLSSALTHLLTQVENMFGKKIAFFLASSRLLQDISQHVLDNVSVCTLNVCMDHPHIVRRFVELYLRCRLHYYFKYETRQTW